MSGSIHTQAWWEELQATIREKEITIGLLQAENIRLRRQVEVAQKSSIEDQERRRKAEQERDNMRALWDKLFQEGTSA